MIPDHNRQLHGSLNQMMFSTLQRLKKALTFSIVMLVVSFDLIVSVYADIRSSRENSQHETWISDQSFGFPIYIALNFTYGKTRHVYLLIVPNKFTERDLRKVFKDMSDRYGDLVILEMTAFSDEMMLQRAVNRRKSGVFIDFENTPEGVEAQGKWALKHEPLPTVYFRAFYFRSREREDFRYSPDPNSEDYKTITLKCKPNDSCKCGTE